jgi:transposase
LELRIYSRLTGNVSASILRLSLDSYPEEHTHILASLSRITKQLAEAAIQLGHGERIKHLRTIPGVGVTIAHTFVSEIFRAEHLKIKLP